jgi:uncharacterized protein (TIGR00288 family)
LTPWWLRPSAEGASNEEQKQQQDPSHSPSQPAESSEHSEPPAAPSRLPAHPEQAAAAGAGEDTAAPYGDRGGHGEHAGSRDIGDIGGIGGIGSSRERHDRRPHGEHDSLPRSEQPSARDTSAAAEPATPVYRLPHPAERQEHLDTDEQLSDEPHFPPSAAAETAEPMEGEEGDEEARAEVKRKRSRRGRGGRRKNGRAASSGVAGAPGVPGAGGEMDEDDDDGPPEEPVAHGPQRLVRTGEPAALQPRPVRDRDRESYVISATDFEPMNREIVISVPDRQRSLQDERKIAVFCDLENVALGVRDSEIGKFDIDLILERLLEKGKIIVKKAYADWERYSDYKRPFHEAAIELIDIPQKYYSGKNSADIKMVVDAMDLSYSKEHLDTFVILSGDSDFSPLVSKLKENNKYVIGIGVKNSSSNLLVDNCDEFIYYEDVWRDSQTGPKLDGLNKKTAEAFSLMVESIQALVRENKDVLWGSMIKQTMQRKKPSFNEGYYGYSTFSELLEDAERKNIIKLKKDQRSGTYIVTGFAKSGDAGPGRRSV